jgi:hypothetical protein
MKGLFCLLIGMLLLGIFCNDAVSDGDNIYFARCNLKVIKGNYITWVNWQAAPEYLPVGTKFKVKLKGKSPSLVDINTGAEYTLDVGAEGENFLEKFIIRSPVDLSRFSKDIQDNINNAVARVGMTKEEVYIAMGPPAWITGGNTDSKTYGNIMASNLWVYKRNRFGKNIGVEFNSSTGKVVRTEGIWR